MIKELPADARPREKLLARGPQSLSDAELLAILIRTGTPRDSALRVAERLLLKYGESGLTGLGGVSARELSRIKGIGAVKAVTIVAALELGKRLAASSRPLRPVIKSPVDVANLMMERLRYEVREHFVVVMLSTKNHVLGAPVVSVGSLNASLVDPKEVFRQALEYSAAAVVLVHNHPSGDPSPSPEDIALTKRLVQGGQILEITVLDHLIIGDGKYVSLKEKGII